jgi:hypothetical protein
MVTNWIISYGFNAVIRHNLAYPLSSSPLLDALERSRNSFGLEGVKYEYWGHPTPNAIGSFWIKNQKTVVILLSEGFLNAATESQVATMMESLNSSNFQEIRRINRMESLLMIFDRWKGESRHFRFWVVSFFLYPLERFLKIAKI